MNTLTTRQALVLWNAEHSMVQDLSTKAFAERLCLMMDDDAQNMEFMMADFAEQIGISRNSVQKYLRALQESGEWSVISRRGISTIITPNFLPDVLAWLEAEKTELCR